MKVIRWASAIVGFLLVVGFLLFDDGSMERGAMILGLPFFGVGVWYIYECGDLKGLKKVSVAAPSRPVVREQMREVRNSDSSSQAAQAQQPPPEEPVLTLETLSAEIVDQLISTAQQTEFQDSVAGLDHEKLLKRIASKKSMHPYLRKAANLPNNALLPQAFEKVEINLLRTYMRVAGRLMETFPNDG